MLLLLNKKYERPDAPSGGTSRLFWFKPDDAATFTYSSGTSITNWSDSANSNDLSVGAFGEPTYVDNFFSDGLGYVSFDGSDDALKGTFTYNQPCTIMFLVNVDNLANNARAFDGNAVNNMAIFNNNDGSNNILRLFSGAFGPGYNFDSSPGWHFVTYIVNGSSSKCYLDGDLRQTADAGATNPAGLVMGGAGDGSLNGEVLISETIGFASALGDNEILTYTNYIKQKYNYLARN